MSSNEECTYYVATKMGEVAAITQWLQENILQYYHCIHALQMQLHRYYRHGWNTRRIMLQFSSHNIPLIS